MLKPLEIEYVGGIILLSTLLGVSTLSESTFGVSAFGVSSILLLK